MARGRQREPRYRKAGGRLSCPTTEYLVAKALKNLKHQRFIDFFIHAEQSDPLDAAHIDFLLCKKKKLIALQVKGHIDSLIKHIERYPLIPVILIDSTMRNSCLSALERALLSIFYNEQQSHELILDERTVETIRARIEIEGFLHLSPFV